MLFFIFILMPVRYRDVCVFVQGDRRCYKQYVSPSGVEVHPILAVFAVMCVVLAAFMWLYRRPSPPFVNRLMEGRGWRFTVLRWLVYVAIGALVIGVFFVAPLWVIEHFDAPTTSWKDWAPMALIAALWTFLIAFGPNDVGGKPWRGHQQPSAFLGPDRQPPPDSRRY